MKVIPIYTTMTVVIHKSCIEEIQRLQGKIIWGEYDNERKCHEVGWEKVIKPKEMCSLVLRRLDLMNKACILKLIWQLHSGAKYKWSESMKDFVDRSLSSSLWKVIVKLWPNLTKCCFWYLGDGRSVEAWSCAWIDLEVHVNDMNLQIYDDIKHVKVLDFVSNSGMWILY